VEQGNEDEESEFRVEEGTRATKIRSYQLIRKEGQRPSAMTISQIP
jgi:hypothetical protein